MAEQVYLMQAMAAGKAAARPGPDDDDDPDWERVPPPRQNQLLIAGQQNAKMRGYLDQIRRKHARDRSPMEQWTVVAYNIMEVNEDLGPAPPLPTPTCPSPMPMLIALGAAVVVLLVLVMVMSWRRGWKQPFGACNPEVVNPMRASALRPVSCG